MDTAPKDLYFGADRAERRRVAKALAGIRDAPDRAALEKVTERQPRAPLELLACGFCGKPTSSCACIDGEGKPLVWTLG